jgi:hypothetical protein
MLVNLVKMPASVDLLNVPAIDSSSDQTDDSLNSNQSIAEESIDLLTTIQINSIPTEKRALITGITGQDGSYLAEFLIQKGYKVHGIMRRSSSFNTGRIQHLYKDPMTHQQDCKQTNQLQIKNKDQLIAILIKS